MVGLTQVNYAQSGYALSLPGGTGLYTTTSLAIPALNSLISTYPFTVEMWVKPTAYVSYGGFWVDRSSSINSVQFDNNAGAYLRSDFAGNARFVSSLTAAKPTAGVWNHISMIARADSIIIELNGTYYKVATVVSSASIAWNSLFFSNISYVGSDPVVAGRNVAGLYDEVRFWNTARTPAQIDANKVKTLTGTESGLVAYYNFDSQNANDLTANAKNATANGGSYAVVVNAAADATLAAINLTNGVLDKDFLGTTTSYTALVPPTYTSTTVTGTKSQTAATLTNSPSDISLSTPTTTMVCTSSNGGATTNYTVNFKRTTLDDWDANGAAGNRSYPNLWGWNCSNTTTCWSLANSSGTACRYNEVTTGWTYNGATWTGRNMYVRWDGTGATTTSSVYSYPLYLDGCKTYTLAFKYSWANNATVPTFKTTISTDNAALSPLVTGSFICSSTKQTLQKDSLTFTPPTAGVYYFTINANTAALCAIADLSLSVSSTKSLNTSVSALSFDDLNKSRTFIVSGNALTDSIKLTFPAGVTLSTKAISATDAQCGVSVTAVFDGIKSINDSITLKSGTSFSKIIKVSSVAGDGVCFTPLYPDKTNIITDPFINNLSNFTGWGTKSLDSIAPYCGKYSGKITTSGSIDFSLPLTPYTKYRMKAMVKTIGGSFQIGVAKYDGTTGDINQVFDTNGIWQAIDFTFNTGATVAGALTFFNNYLKDGTTGYIDNWELYAIGTVSGVDVQITTNQISESNVKATIRQMLAKHLVYAEGKYVSASGYFGKGSSVEDGARPNADYALVYAFIYKNCQDQTLPNGLTFDLVKQHALAAIRYSYKTHVANKTITCSDGLYWGIVWESSMWTESLGYAAWLMWSDLTDADKAAIKNVIVSEANYNLSRTIPTGINSDTKAEENGWDTNILAVAASMFPEEKNAEAWTLRCKQFAMNTYSVASDLYRKDPVADVVDGKTVADWHIGGNLFPDYALENHNFFHTSYLNIPIQEMSESLLAYRAIQNQTTPTFAIPNALKHNVKGVWDTMLKELIMADGMEAMPNGNDWSMYIYDELSTYSAMASIYRDADALMMESLILQWAKYRQSTCGDGAFLLNPDVAERRMAVTARRLVFAHMYHDYYPTNTMVATKWADFSKKHEQTKILPYSNIIRNNNDDKYVTFSWFQSVDGTSYKSYMGMVSPNNPNYSNMVFPFKVANTGNFTGYIDVSGYTRNASYVSNTNALYPKSFATTGRLSVTGGSFNKYLTFYSTPGKATIYQEDMVGAVAGSVTKDGGLLLGITTDVLTKISRTLYSQSGSISSSGDALSSMAGNWVNVDNELGMVVNGGNGIAFGEKELNTSVYISKLYGSYSTAAKSFASGDVVYSRSAIVYPNIDAATTQLLASKAKYPAVATGWKATAAEDPDGRRYLVMSNFRSAASSAVTLVYPQGAPVYDRVTTVTDTTGTATFNTVSNSSAVNELYSFVKTGSSALQAIQGDSPYSVFVKNANATDVTADVSIWNNGTYKTLSSTIPAGTCKYFDVQRNVLSETLAAFPDGYRNISRGKHAIADDQWPEHFPQALIDDNDSTFYQSLILPTVSVPENITIRLWGLFSCNKLVVKSAEGIGPKAISIQISSDGATFTTVGTATLNNTTEDQTVSFTDSDAKYVRIKVNSTYGTKNVGITAIQLFGYPK